MDARAVPVVLASLVVASTVTGLVTASPPRPGTADNGLSETEAATLWSRDADRYMPQTEYRQRYGENRTAIHQLANATDITFARPPATAATWTRHDFAALQAGDRDTALHPPHASLTDGTFIADAHATVFAVQPSTRAHLDAGTTPRYIAPDGTLRGFVDYRVRVPDGHSEGNRTVTWSLASHEIESVRLQSDGRTVVERNGTHTPALDYRLDDDRRTTLTLVAEIDVRLEQTTRIDRGNETEVRVTTRTESVTVSDSIPVVVYNLTATAYYAAYPNGDTGVAVFQSRPWHGLTVAEEGAVRVRGVWRFYTARNTSWETLIRSTRTDTTTIESDAIPVFVHAYPSRIGPRVEPVGTGPTLITTWGTERPSPRGTIGDHVHVEVVNQSYTTTQGIAVRAEQVDPAAVQVTGIVRGVNATIIEPGAGAERQLRHSNLTVTVSQQNRRQATLRIELRDNRTGEPIVLNESARRNLITRTAHNGSITVADRRIETNDSGVAVVTITQPGVYTVRYQPGSWLGQYPAYVGDTATVRWHPLGTLAGWVALVVELGWQLIPFVVMVYAGHRLLRLLSPEAIFERNQ